MGRPHKTVQQIIDTDKIYWSHKVVQQIIDTDKTYWIFLNANLNLFLPRQKINTRQ